jgi:hypothetical protein
MWSERASTRKNSSELEEAYALLLEKVKGVDPLTAAEATGGRYVAKGGVPRVDVQFLHSWFSLDLLPYRVRGAHEAIDTLPLKALFLHHVLAAAEAHKARIRPTGRWIDLRSLHNGAMLGAHTAKSTAQALDAFFAMDHEARTGRALTWAGRPASFGDEAYLFHFYPNVPIALINWLGDQDFPPYAKVLYDESACDFMPTHGLVVLTEYLIHRLAD